MAASAMTDEVRKSAMCPGHLVGAEGSSLYLFQFTSLPYCPSNVPRSIGRKPKVMSVRRAHLVVRRASRPSRLAIARCGICSNDISWRASSMTTRSCSTNSGLCQGDVRIDVAAVNGELAGFEIKSPADTLARWPKQCRIYSKVVDRAWLVATEKALEAAQAPGWWGVIRIVQTPDQLGLRVIRPAQHNPSTGPVFDRAPAVARRSHPGAGRTRPGARRSQQAARRSLARLADAAPLDHLRAAVRAALKVRAKRVEDLAQESRKSRIAHRRSACAVGSVAP